MIEIYRWRNISNTDIWSCRHRKYKPRWVIECKECSMTAYLCSAQHSAYWCKQPNWKVALRLSCPLNEPGTFPQSVYRHHFEIFTHFSSSPLQCLNISYQISAVSPHDHLKFLYFYLHYRNNRNRIARKFICYHSLYVYAYCLKSTSAAFIATITHIVPMGRAKRIYY